MATVWIDGRPCAVDPAKNLLEVSIELGLDLPYFCWHPALGSAGACRQCAVKQYRDAADTRGRLVMACMTPAREGTRISIVDPEARSFRASVIELLMVNHPHDCPVCDEGGECHLQDMTLMTGHTVRSYRHQKRTYHNQNLGPFVNHEMNRCVQCYRCVRFYADFAGGSDLQALGAHDSVYFGRAHDGPLESEFSGNLVEICPTGVFTDKTLKRHYTRKWDLTTAPSVCVHCAVGCNTTPGERTGKLRRIRARYNGAVNGYFLCDRGRYGYEFVNHERRIRNPLLPHGPAQPATVIPRQEAVRRLALLLRDGRRVIGIGSPRASLEANFALRCAVGPDRFFQGSSSLHTQLADDIVDILSRGRSRSPSLREIERRDAVLVLGEDVTNTAPMMALALRQSIRQEPLRLAAKAGIPAWQDQAVRDFVQQHESGPLFIATCAPTKLDDVARRTFRGAPEELSRLGAAVAHLVDSDAPEPRAADAAMLQLATQIALALRVAERPLVVSGSGCGSREVLQAAANVAWALEKVGKSSEIALAVPECNSMGLALLGGAQLDVALETVAAGGADTVIVLENDLYRRADRRKVDRLFATARHVVVLDHIAHETCARAELVLPASTFAESTGILVNNEGRAQRFYQVFVAEADVRESWRWISDADSVEGTGNWANEDALVAQMAAELPVFAALTRLAPRSDFRIAGARVPRQPHRWSGRTALTANVSVHEPKPPDDPDAPFSFSMEGYSGRPPPQLAAEFWEPGYNSIQALNRFQEELAGPLRGGDPGVRLLEPESVAERPPYSAPAEPVRRLVEVRLPGIGVEAPGRQGAPRRVDCGSPRRAHTVLYVTDEQRRRPGCIGDEDGEIISTSLPTPGGQFRIVPLQHIFGSEELSVLAPGVAELQPRAYVALGPEDAAAIGLADGEDAMVTVGAAGQKLPVQIVRGLASGTAGLPFGLPGLKLCVDATLGGVHKA